ncbi:relaxase/mobilization nuclease domain-containing protein [Stappia indica]|uniref:relaxase/mobilization nuclease domain-containing protein n=1 Tax=Stappia indica TaxID=538381 RepID=UPI0008320718|nr:relaxase/mobilization nuclease domain-containing protein [Stappia indica]
MILDGNQRGGARDLAVHLMKPENEHVEIHEIRGFMADTVLGALREAEAVSRGTRCRQHLYSLSLSPPETECVPVSVFEAAIERIEDRLGLSGHPRVVVFHEKKGRRHAHCVWSRIDADTMTAVRMSHDRRKLGALSRELYLEHGWKMPEGLIDPALRNPFNFDRKEWFQAQQAGKDPRDIKAALQQCWAASDSGKALVHALEARGYYLARGDRGRIVAVDTQGEVYALARWIGLKTKDVRQRIGDPDTLPSVEDTKRKVASLVRDRLSGFIGSVIEDFSRAAAQLEGQRLAMVERHRRDRSAIDEAQRRREDDEARQRASRLRKGLLGLWDRLTGKHGKLKDEIEREANACALRDATERQALIDRQRQERLALQKEIDEERRQHVRELARLHREISRTARMQEQDQAVTADLKERRRRSRHRRLEL